MALMHQPVCDFGWPAPDFALTGTDGKTHSLADVAGPKGTLIMFLCNHCPYVKAVIEDIVRDVGDLMRDHGIGAAAVMSNDTDAYPEDGFDKMQALADRLAFPFPYLLDPTQAVGRAYNAICTPDFFGFDATLGLQYRGRLSAATVRPAPGARRDLFEAMVQVAATGQGPREQVPSMGCSIKWRAAA